MEIPKDNHFWIKISNFKKSEDEPSEILIQKEGKIYIDGQLYDEHNPKYKNLAVSIETYNKLNTGEETEKLIDSYKKSKKGESEIIKEIRDPNKTESTVVKY